MPLNFFDHAQLLIGSINGWITQTLHGNSMVAGAVTASVAGSLFYLLRKFPKAIWFQLRRFILFTYQIEYTVDYYNRDMITEVAQKLEYDLQKHVSRRRPIARLVARKKRIVESLSDGGFFFLHERAPIYVSRKHEVSDKKATSASGGGEVRITISMTALRCHREKMMAVLHETAREYMVPGIYQITTSNYGGYPGANRIRNFTRLPVLAIDADVKAQVDEALDNFIQNRELNNQQDIPHKLVFMFYGEPGTGKSTLAEYISFRLKTSLFCLNAQSGDRGGHNLTSVVEVARDNIDDSEVPVVLCDDFDTFWNGLKKRAPRPKNPDNPIEGMMEPEESPNLGRLLVSLQSPTQINDCVVIFSTNHLEKIDPALYRPGRVTVMIEVGRMKPKSIMEYFEASYGQKWPEHTPIERALRACDITAFYEKNLRNPAGFVKAVITAKAAADEVFQAKVPETIS